MAISISCGNPPRGDLGVPYTHTFPVTGLLEGETYTITLTGNLPPGLTLDVHTGVITGTPTHAGTYSFTLSIDVIRDLIDSATLNVVTAKAQGGIYTAYESTTVCANNAAATMFGPFLSAMDNDAYTQGASPGPGAHAWPKWTNAIDVLTGAAVTVHPEMKFDPYAENLVYPVTVQTWEGATFPPRGYNDLSIFGFSLDVHRADGSSGTLIPRDWQIDYGTGYSYVPPDSTTDYIRNPGNAIDEDLDTYATLYHDGLHVHSFPRLIVGSDGWYAAGDHDEVRCSITIIGPNNILDLWVWRELFRFDALDQKIQFPPGYEQALRLQLASDFARQFPGRDRTRLKLQLAKAIEHIDKENISNSQAVEDLPPPEQEQ